MPSCSGGPLITNYMCRWKRRTLQEADRTRLCKFQVLTQAVNVLGPRLKGFCVMRAGATQARSIYGDQPDVEIGKLLKSEPQRAAHPRAGAEQDRDARRWTPLIPSKLAVVSNGNGSLSLGRLDLHHSDFTRKPSAKVPLRSGKGRLPAVVWQSSAVSSRDHRGRLRGERYMPCRKAKCQRKKAPGSSLFPEREV